MLVEGPVCHIIIDLIFLHWFKVNILPISTLIIVYNYSAIKVFGGLSWQYKVCQKNIRIYTEQGSCSLLAESLHCYTSVDNAAHLTPYFLITAAKKKVDVIFRFVRAGHRSSPASLGWGKVQQSEKLPLKTATFKMSKYDTMTFRLLPSLIIRDWMHVMTKMYVVRYNLMWHKSSIRSMNFDLLCVLLKARCS